MRVLITGISGFAGSHLAEVCLSQGAEVWGITRHNNGHPNLAHLEGTIRLCAADITCAAEVAAVVAQAAPDRIFHLAAQAHVPTAWKTPAATLETNIIGQLNVILAMQVHAPEARLLAVGSSNVYGMVRPEDIPVAEETPFRPADPYAVSKIAQDMLALQYWESHRLAIVRVRPFNHIGPRQSPEFVVSRFARTLAQIEAGQLPPLLRVGNLSAQRDFTDVRDIARAYWLALERGEPGAVYNVGSGEAHAIEEILAILRRLARVSVEVVTDPALFRPGDFPILAANATRFRQQTGWQPRFPLAETLRDTLDYWRTQVTAAAPEQRAGDR